MKLILVFFFAFCFCTTIKAQSYPLPKWMSQKGFWVIEGNLHSPKNATVYFYTNNRELVYKEEVTGKRLNPERIKTRKHLESVLLKSITAWEMGGVAKENQKLVVTKAN